MPVKKKRTTKKSAARKKAAPRKRSASVGRSKATILSDAKKGGFRRKKPKKPKSKTIASLENYIAKVAQWERDMKTAASGYNRLQVLKKRVAAM